MALKITKIAADPNDEYATREAFHADYADVVIETPDADANALLVACDLDEGTATMVATHGVWPDATAEAGTEVEKLPVFTVEFSGVDLENMSDLAELASFAVLDKLYGYDPAAWRAEFIAQFEAAISSSDDEGDEAS
jgi:hypothetical protein